MKVMEIKDCYDGDVLIKPLALDLCCGKGGWTAGLLAAGWDVIGVDIEQWDGYPGGAYFMKADVSKISGPMHDKQGRKISLVVASPPCQEFSYRSFPFKRCRELAANVPPNKSIWNACVRIAYECNAPLILENVRGAQKYMGKAAAHYGSFYLWGDVPAILPIGNPIKGFNNPDAPRGGFGKNHKYKCGFPGECERKIPVNRFSDHPGEKMSSQSMSRKEWSAQVAMIPIELSTWIGKCFYPSQMVEK